MQAIGQLKHHFWGDYCADVILKFSCSECAKSALQLLPGWKQTENFLVKRLSEEQLDAFKEQLKEWGCKVRACGRRDCRHQCKDAEIDSVNHSIDSGPLFDVNVPAEHINQLQLI